jgi:hypothetical protein
MHSNGVICYSQPAKALVSCLLLVSVKTCQTVLLGNVSFAPFRTPIPAKHRIHAWPSMSVAGCMTQLRPAASKGKPRLQSEAKIANLSSMRRHVYDAHTLDMHSNGVICYSQPDKALASCLLLVSVKTFQNVQLLRNVSFAPFRTPIPAKHRIHAWPSMLAAGMCVRLCVCQERLHD